MNSEIPQSRRISDEIVREELNDSECEGYLIYLFIFSREVFYAADDTICSKKKDIEENERSEQDTVIVSTRKFNSNTNLGNESQDLTISLSSKISTFRTNHSSMPLNQLNSLKHTSTQISQMSVPYQSSSSEDINFPLSFNNSEYESQPNITNKKINLYKKSKSKDKMDTIYETAMNNSLEGDNNISNINLEFLETLHRFTYKPTNMGQKSTEQTLQSCRTKKQLTDIRFESEKEIDMEFMRNNLRSIYVKVSHK
jgi:hypothetical protein